MVVRHDLFTAHEALEAESRSHSMRLLLMRHLILEIANVADLASTSGGLYKKNPELGELYRPIRTALPFFKYLRNIYVGHFTPELTDKTFEWIPFTNAILGGVQLDKQLVVSWFALETAINTYADPESGHKIFDSETDLNYPPDLTRFLNFLGETAEGSIAYITELITVSRSYVDLPDVSEDMLQLSVTAGQTEFSVLTKRKR